LGFDPIFLAKTLRYLGLTIVDIVPGLETGFAFAGGIKQNTWKMMEKLMEQDLM
jgi:hypothetical protein